MRMRGLGAAVVLALIGVAGGFGGARLLHDAPATVAEATPVPASDPSAPVDPERPYAHDIDYPALQAGLDYKRHTLGDPPYQWAFLAPKGWVATLEDVNEYRWRPAGEPPVGGYSLRVKLVTEHKTPEQMVSQKLAAMESGYDDVEVLGRTQNLLSFGYRDPGSNTHRFNTFQWFTISGDTVAKFEMSVVGREADRQGLDDLMQQVARSIEPVRESQTG